MKERLTLRKYLPLMIAGLFFVSANPSWARISPPAQDCEKFLLTRAELEAAHDYPRNVDPVKMPGGFYMYGLEAEYALDGMATRLMSFYAPSEDLLSRATWNGMALPDRVQWAKDHWDLLFPQGPNKPSNLIRFAGDENLPPYLVADETGNVELVSQPFDSHLAMIGFMDMVEGQIGPAYLQASISSPAKPIFQTSRKTDGFIGYRLLIGSYDEILKLSEGYLKNQQTPKYVPGKSLTHPFLGPMNSNRANFLRRVVHQNRAGDFDSDVMTRVSSRNASYKYTSQVAYRPDVLKRDDRFVNEIRDCVKSFDCLKKRLDRERFFLGEDFAQFSRFESVRPLDLIADFDLLPESVQKFLQKAFPGPDMEQEAIRNDLASENLVAEKFRSFAYPMQDWASWLDPMGYSPRSVEFHRVKTAQHEYVMTLQQIAQTFSAEGSDLEKAGDQIRIAVAKFAYDSGLTGVYESWFAKAFPQAANQNPPVWK